MMKGNKGKMSLDRIPLLVFRYSREGPDGEEALEAGMVRPGVTFLEATMPSGLRLIFADPKKIEVFDRISIR